MCIFPAPICAGFVGGEHQQSFLAYNVSNGGSLSTTQATPVALQDPDYLSFDWSDTTQAFYWSATYQVQTVVSPQ
jgi:hypothetical protein